MSGGGGGSGCGSGGGSSRSSNPQNSRLILRVREKRPCDDKCKKLRRAHRRLRESSCCCSDVCVRRCDNCKLIEVKPKHKKRSNKKRSHKKRSHKKGSDEEGSHGKGSHGKGSYGKGSNKKRSRKCNGKICFFPIPYPGGNPNIPPGKNEHYFFIYFLIVCKLNQVDKIRIVI